MALFASKRLTPNGQVAGTLLVVEFSDSFHDLWARLADDVGLRLVTRTAHGDLADVRGHHCVIAAIGGVELGSGTGIRRLVAAGAGSVAAVGASIEYRDALGVVRSGASDYF